MLKEVFKDLFRKHTDNESLIDECWNEIEIQYSNKKRHYHTLNHLENLLTELKKIKLEINNWDTILFPLFLS